METALQAPLPAASHPTRTRRYTVDIDIGGTLTDGLYSDGHVVTPVKVETTPHDFTVCFFENLKAGATELGFGDLKSLLAEVAVIRWSATIATNIVAERKGPRIGLLVSAGTGEELYGAGRSAAVEHVVAPENIVALPAEASDADTLAAIRELLEKGVRRIAVSVAGAFEDNSAELAVKDLVDENFPDHYLGAVPLMLGSEICRHPDDQTRTHMALVNAYVHTPLAVSLFKAEDRLVGDFGYRRPLYIAHVNGGVARVAKTTAVDTAESSPYFGLNACAWFARLYGEDRVLALDVGGTTSKVGVIVDGQPVTSEHGDILGVPVQTPSTVLRSGAIGGGSIAATADGELKLGPASQGAIPGPRVLRPRRARGDADRRARGYGDAEPEAVPRWPARAAGRPGAGCDPAPRRRAARHQRRGGGGADRRPRGWDGGRAGAANARGRLAYTGRLQGVLLRRQRRELRGPGIRAARAGVGVRVLARAGAERVRLLGRRDLPSARAVAVPRPHLQGQRRRRRADRRDGVARGQARPRGRAARRR